MDDMNYDVLIVNEPAPDFKLTIGDRIRALVAKLHLHNCEFNSDEEEICI